VARDERGKKRESRKGKKRKRGNRHLASANACFHPKPYLKSGRGNEKGRHGKNETAWNRKKEGGGRKKKNKKINFRCVPLTPSFLYFVPGFATTEEEGKAEKSVRNVTEG